MSSRSTFFCLLLLAGCNSSNGLVVTPDAGGGTGGGGIAVGHRWLLRQRERAAEHPESISLA